ncbi:hypothetical protein PanWU01x14_232610 [Parasponia andersonii]|uniref:Uncharacterized protein n=1 Tax=Parasponia andersonii TaxID=3476 RepID=A0A2P5BJY9_PARAD|nr:hypothetical protein PanWU01x14_232610 [Parasponia andersonii]
MSALTRGLLAKKQQVHRGCLTSLTAPHLPSSAEGEDSPPLSSSLSIPTNLSMPVPDLSYAAVPPPSNDSYTFPIERSLEVEGVIVLPAPSSLPLPVPSIPSLGSSRPKDRKSKCKAKSIIPPDQPSLTPVLGLSLAEYKKFAFLY